MNGPYAVVVGAVNLDIRGTPTGKLVAQDSNPGRVTTSLGGVGRNIAHNMALLGLPTRLVTALGEDMAALQVEESCHALGLDLSGALRVPGGATSTYLFITNGEGEMELAVSDMEIYDALTPEYLETQLDLLNGAKLVVVDANIPAESLDYILLHTKAPLFVDPVSTAKAEKVRAGLSCIHTLKPNKLEAVALAGVEITDLPSLYRAAEKLLETGLQRVIISLGPKGVLCAGQEDMVLLPRIPGEMVNTTGCGDAAMAALAWAFWEDLPLREAGRAALAAGAITLAAPGTINPDMSAELLKSLMATH